MGTRSVLGCATVLLAASPALGQMTWQNASPAVRPPGRWDHALAVDDARGRVVLFGGSDMHAARRDTWEWDGAVWSEQVVSPAPDARRRHAMAWHRKSGRVVLFGGSDATFAPLGDTWTWDGDAWRCEATAIAPPPLEGAALCEDPRRGTLVLFGGRDAAGALHDDTWTWDGASWRLEHPATTPPARWFAGLAHDARRERVVMFGGTVDSSVWEWNGVDWSQRSTSGPSSGFGGLAFDRVRERVVGWCGWCWPQTAWEWDGTRWLDWPLVAAPFSRDSQALAWDPVARRVLMFGGWKFHAAMVFDDTWRWTPGVAGAAQRYGAGCGNGVATPVLAADGAPILGNHGFALSISGARTSSLALVALAARPADTPLPGGCALLVAAPWAALAGVTDVHGTARVALPIPRDVALRGARVHAQGFVADPAGAFLGLAALSGGLRVVVGD